MEVPYHTPYPLYRSLSSKEGATADRPRASAARHGLAVGVTNRSRVAGHVSCYRTVTTAAAVATGHISHVVDNNNLLSS